MSFAILLLNRFLHFMPMRFNLWLGRSLSGIFYMLSGKRKRVTYSNIRASFCHEKSPEEIRVIARGSYTHAAQIFAELIAMTKVDARYIEKYVHVTNFERIQSAAKNPRGMILISAHFGNWELSLAVSAAKGFPLYVLARDQKLKKLNELFNKLRESKGSIVVRKGTDIKRLIRVLKEGSSVGILADQNAGVHGELLELFGRPASTAIGPYRLAQKEGALILPAFIHRRKGPYHELILEEIMSIGKNDDIVPYMEKYNRLLEKHIRQDPTQWFWMHKKWKMNPVKKVVVLNDGRKGHLNQSMAVVSEIRKYRESEGHDPDNIRVKTVSVDFKNVFRRSVFKGLSPFFGPAFQGRPALLRWALAKQSCEALLSEYADIFISTGSGLSSVNRMLKIENYARGVVVLDPGRALRGKFDLVIIPRHDIRPEKGVEAEKQSNVVVTELAPNLVGAEGAGSFGISGEGPPGRKGKLDVGVLIGGENKYFRMPGRIVETVLRQAMAFCDGSGGYLHVTTSRRTSREAEHAAEKTLKGYSRTGTLVMGSSDKDPGTVRKMMEKCDLLVVSGESISMVSEAVSSGKRVLVFMPEKAARKMTKYERFTTRLAERGYLALVDPVDIADGARRALESADRPVLPLDGSLIRKKLYRLF